MGPCMYGAEVKLIAIGAVEVTRYLGGDIRVGAGLEAGLGVGLGAGVGLGVGLGLGLSFGFGC